LWCALVWASFLISVQSVHAVEWEVRRFEGRDYVPLSQAGEFYDLPRVLMQNANTVAFAEAGRSLTFTKNSREVMINRLRHWLSFPVIERDSNVWIARLDLSKTIEPALRPQFIAGIKKPMRVILDAGHGGPDKGAISVYQFEKNFTLDMVRRVRNELTSAGVLVELTRNSDDFIELQDRAAFANDRPDAIFVSLHFNSAANRAAQGFEIFCITPRGAPSTEYEDLLVRDMVKEHGNESEVQSYVLAKAIYHAMHGYSSMMDRGVKRSRFAVLRLTKIPAVLVEGGFLSNPVDARRIASPEWRTRYAKSIAAGILAYLRLAETREVPRLVSDYRSQGEPSMARSLTSPSKSSTPPPSVSLRSLPEDSPAPNPQATPETPNNPVP
jgi:N-acetylmuramoyl-L-alanine amidase